jgi:hypothetical protein
MKLEHQNYSVWGKKDWKGDQVNPLIEVREKRSKSQNILAQREVGISPEAQLCKLKRLPSLSNLNMADETPNQNFKS